jgi:hypothetical protein
MINIISRSLIFKNVSGPKKVVDNLIKGLDKIGYPYVLNKRLDYCSCLYIHDDRVALQKVKELDPRVRVVVGPNLYVVPRDLPHSLDISRAVYLVPSEWNKRFWLHFGFDKCPMEAWGAGIDTEEFSPSGNKKEFILLYFKQRFNEELERVEKELKKKNLKHKLLHYDKGYNESDFKDFLEKSRYVIWLGRQESQGIALQEVLSSNIPVLVCDVSSVGHCIGGGELNQEEKDYTDTSSASYFDDRCGVKIKDLGFVGNAIDEMEGKLHSFTPREYILENLTLEGQAKKMIGFYEKYFHVSYIEGLAEKPVHLGNWINAKWYYVFYLKLKHWIKILLVKIGLWKLIKG